jgi:hypothetical protein
VREGRLYLEWVRGKRGREEKGEERVWIWRGERMVSGFGVGRKSGKVGGDGGGPGLGRGEGAGEFDIGQNSLFANARL